VQLKVKDEIAAIEVVTPNIAGFVLFIVVAEAF